MNKTEEYTNKTEKIVMIFCVICIIACIVVLIAEAYKDYHSEGWDNTENDLDDKGGVISYYMYDNSTVLSNVTVYKEDTVDCTDTGILIHRSADKTYMYIPYEKIRYVNPNTS